MAGDVPGGGDTSGGAAATAAAASETTGLADYYRVLAQNRHFRFLWTAEMVDNVGSWLVS